MKRTLPLILAMITGFIVLISEFIPHWPLGLITSEIEKWFLIISGFALILGQINLIKVNISKIHFKVEGWQYFVITIASFGIMVLFGAFWGTQSNSGLLGDGAKIVEIIGSKPFDYLFDNIYQHLQATMFSLLAFFIASAAYRAFIARTPESSLLLIAAILVMLGNTSLGSFLTGWLPESLDFLHLPNVSQFIMKYPTTAGQRAIMIGVGLGMTATSLKILLGIERTYLGGGD